MSGSSDGTVQIRDTSNLGQCRTFRAQGWRQNNVGAVSVCADGGIYCGGKDGCFQVWRDDSKPLPDDLKIEAVPFKRISQDRRTKYFEMMIEDEYLETMKDEISRKKKVQLDKLTKIRTELGFLLSENEKHDELEKLTRDEFAIDLESREKVAQAGREKCLKIKEESRQKNLTNEVLAKKLKQITWDRMETHLKGENGLKNNYVVFNYQLRRVSKEERRRLGLIFDLRRAQKKEEKKRNPDLSYEWYNNKNVVNGGVVQPLILPAAVEKKEEKALEKTAKKKKEEEAAKNEEATE